MTNISMDVALGLPNTLKKHAIGLVSGASLLNLPHYRVNPTEHIELKRQVDLKLSSAEVAENKYVNRTIDESSGDEIAYGLGPRQLTNLILIADQCKVFKPASSLASPVALHMHELNKSVIRLHKTTPIMSYELMLGTY